MSAADWLSSLRLMLVPLIWIPALQGHGRLVGLGLIAAGATDVLDGYLARRRGEVAPRGARLDAIADIVLLVSAAGWDVMNWTALPFLAVVAAVVVWYARVRSRMAGTLA